VNGNNLSPSELLNGLRRLDDEISRTLWIVLMFWKLRAPHWGLRTVIPHPKSPNVIYIVFDALNFFQWPLVLLTKYVSNES
jgi:hypothetical protein